MEWKIWNPLNNEEGYSAIGNTEITLPTTFNEIKVTLYDGQWLNYSVLLTKFDVENIKGTWGVSYNDNHRMRIYINNMKISIDDAVNGGNSTTSSAKMWIYYR